MQNWASSPRVICIIGYKKYSDYQLTAFADWRFTLSSVLHWGVFRTLESLAGRLMSGIEPDSGSGLLANQLGLTESGLSKLLSSGKQTTFANRVNWAKSYLGKAGLIDLTRRGHFVISDMPVLRHLDSSLKPPSKFLKAFYFPQLSFRLSHFSGSST